MPHQPARSAITPVAAIVALGGLLLALAGLLTAVSGRFGYAWRVEDMPVLWLVAGLMGGGALYLLLPVLIRYALPLTATKERRLLLFVFALGLAMRAVLMAGEPVLEDDYQRYLWDGGVTAHGLNPYALAPAAVRAMPAGSTLGRLARASEPVIGRINHPQLRSLYPPVAQGAFALAHVMAPWRLITWRALLLLGDMATFALLVFLLGEVGRSTLWAGLYWWSPLVLKELFNSAHMEAILLPLLIGALALAARKRTMAATVTLALATGVKIWPALLLPLLLRPLLLRSSWRRSRRLVAALAVFAGLLALMAWPILAAGLDSSSGFLAYAERWQTNNAFLPVLARLVTPLAGLANAAGLPPLAPGLLARGLIAAVLGALAIGVAIRPWRDAEALICRAMLVVGALVLLSPAQFPWYAVWIVPFLAFRPLWGFLALALTMPLYYMGFHLMPRDTYDLYTGTIVWLVWVPAWVLLAVELIHGHMPHNPVSPPAAPPPNTPPVPHA